MANIEKFPLIDYEDLIEDLKDDLDSGYINADSMLYVVRQNVDISVECAGDEIFKPVIEYFYSEPTLRTELFETTVDAAKKVCYSLPEIIDRGGNNEAGVSKDSAKATIGLIIEELSDYTKGNGKRNDRSCKLLLTEVDGTMPAFPMAVYFDDSSVCDKLEEITADTLLKELLLCAGKNS